jgi:hypothetical protein
LDSYRIIWCSAHCDWTNPRPSKSAVLWVLELPEDKILAVADAYIWNKIIGIQVVPRSLQEKWSDEAPEGDDAYSAYIEQQMATYHAQPEPPGGWWSQLFIADSSAEGATVLLEHPIPESWVIEPEH